MIAIILGILLSFLGSSSADVDVVIVPPVAQASEIDDELDWFIYNLEAERDYRAEFTAIFDAVEVKWSKNNRLMVKGTHAKSFKFVSKK
jgi:hypothetical protein